MKSASFLIIDFLINLLHWFSWFSPFPVFYGIFRNQIVHTHGYRIAEASRMEYLVTIVEGF